MENEKRFKFGENWKLFLKNLTSDKILRAKKSLQNLIPTANLEGKTFLDIGSGSGVFSLGAYQLGLKVTSFDYDDFSVEATKHVKEKFTNGDEAWNVMQGDVLNYEYIKNLKKFDIVYSWGVLHHTGNMYKALEHAGECVKEDGILIVAIYNTQIGTPIWRIIKKTYVGSPFIIKKLMEYFFATYTFLQLFLYDIMRLKNPFNRHTNHVRGMNFYRDIVDWIGGYPFETAKPEEIFDFYKQRGFILEKMMTVGGKHGCNQFVFKKYNNA